VHGSRMRTHSLVQQRLTRSKLSRITGRSAAGAKVETKAAKKASHEQWKAMWWGRWKDQRRSRWDLCSVRVGGRGRGRGRLGVR